MSRLWYVNTAVHMWRFYFRYMNADPNRMTEPSALNWSACKRVTRLLTDKQIDMLKQYYLTGYGNYEDLQAVAEYAKQNGIREREIWDLVKMANYEVIVERGLMERNAEQKKPDAEENTNNRASTTGSEDIR